MRIRVDGQPIAPEFIGVDPRWQLKDDSTRVSVRCTVAVTRAEVLSKFRRYYDDFVADGRDYPPEDDEPIAKRLEALGWPDLDHLLAHEPRVFEKLALDVGYDLVEALLSDQRRRGESCYFISGIDVAALGPDHLELQGVATDPCPPMVRTHASQPPST